MFRSQKQTRGRSRAFRSADRRNQAKEDFGGAVSGARACAAEKESGGTEGELKRYSVEFPSTADGRKSPHPVAQTAQSEADAASPQQPSSDKSAC